MYFLWITAVSVICCVQNVKWSGQLNFVHKFLSLALSCWNYAWQFCSLKTTSQIWLKCEIKLALMMDYNNVAPCQMLDVMYMITAVMPLISVAIPLFAHLIDEVNSKRSFNSLAPGIYYYDFEYVIFKQILVAGYSDAIWLVLLSLLTKSIFLLRCWTNIKSFT